MKTICGAVLFVTCLCASHANQLPKDFEKCPPEDSGCIVRRANEIIHTYPESFNQLHLEKIEPMEVKSLMFAGNPNTPVNFELTITDMKVHGVSNLTITKIEGFRKDPKDMKDLLFEGIVPLVNVYGKYKTSGKLLLIPISGDGDIHISIKNLKIKMQVTAVLHVRDGKTYITCEKPKIKAKADGMHIDPKHLFNGEKTLADTTAKVINDNWRLLWDEISPQISQQMAQKIIGVMNSFYDQFAYEDLFL